MINGNYPFPPPDPRVLNLDKSLFKIIADHFKPNVDLVAIHLRDARNMLASIQEDGKTFERPFTKAVILLSAAALESNLVYFSDLCLTIATHRPDLYLPPQLDYLRGSQEYVNEKGDLKTRRLKQGLEEKLKVVPSLLGRSMGRKYRFPPQSAVRKLRKSIEWRDVIVHPRWGRYVSNVGWYDAAQAIDAVELYLASVTSQLHPYLSFIDLFLYTIPAGGQKDDLAIAHRTVNQRRARNRFSTMPNVGIPEIINREWLEAQFLTEFALQSQTEGDSDGSMLTRSALVLLYAMLDAQLSLMAEAYLHTNKFSFEQSEASFLSEVAVGVDAAGDISVAEGYQHFKQRIIGVPRILARRVEGRDIAINLGDQALQALIGYKDLRDAVMHPQVGSALPRVSKDELRGAEKAVHSYFKQLADSVPSIFGLYTIFL
jgi:hypothetical protein